MIPHAQEARNELEEDLDTEFEIAKQKEAKWYDQVLLNRPSKVIFGLLLTAIIAPLLIYHFLFFISLGLPPSDGHSVGSCTVQRTLRLPCGIGGVTEDECHSQCCYDHHSHMCFHRLPSRFSYIMFQEWAEDIILHPRISTIPFSSQRSTENIRLSIDEISSTHMALTFYNSQEMSLNGTRIESKEYIYEVSSPEMNVIVNGTQGAIFNTIRGPLIASNNIWEIAFKLTEESMYGLGELPLREDTYKVIYSHSGGISSIPLIYARSNGTYHGLLIDTNTPTEVNIRTENQIVVRSITNIGLKFHIFVGPEPKDIMNDVMKFIGVNKQLKYWMLGAHICSELSETTTGAYNDLNNFIGNATNEKLPFESHCGTIPIIFDNECESEETNIIEAGADLVKYSNKRFVPHVSPYIRYEHNSETSEEDETEDDTRTNSSCTNVRNDFEEYMLRNPKSEIYIGTAGEYDVIYPDYRNTSYEFMRRLWVYNTSLDGVILTNNWPLDNSNKTHNDTYLYLPYFNKNFEEAFEHTPQWNITGFDGERYFSRHNEYGNDFIKVFKKISNEETPTWSTSQWLNGEVMINEQSVNASWTNLRRELIKAALGGVSGHWFWSSPICGDTEHFDSDTQTALCVKWYMAATFLPMIKIHSKTVARDPLSFTGMNKIHMINALNRRLSFLPYFYTTLQEGPLLRPMFYQFPSVDALHNISSQFSVGDDLLIVPNLQPSQSHVHIWLPPGMWYEIWSGLKLEGEEGQAITMTTTEADFMTLIRGGSVLVMQKNVQETADETRLYSNYTLIIAGDCRQVNETDQIGQTMSSQITVCEAAGKFYMTKDMTISFETDLKKLTVKTIGEDFDSFCDTDAAVWAHTIEEVNLYGLDELENNYDHSIHLETSINLCDLKSSDEITVTFNQ